MQSSKQATTLVEAMVVMLIIVTWLVGVYNIFQKSRELSISTQNRIIATQIAREWIEWVNNIRDTNWKIFWVNTQNCWMVSTYNQSCITNPTLSYSSGSYKISTDSDHRWQLEFVATPPTLFSDENYRNTFAVYTDAQGFFTQSWGTLTDKPFFTREIKLTWSWSDPYQEYKIQSIVRWTDSGRKIGNYEVKLTTELTNWKK